MLGNLSLLLSNVKCLLHLELAAIEQSYKYRCS